MIPAIIQCSGIKTIDILNLYFATKLGDPEIMIGITMQTVLADILITFTLVGMNGALETLVSQAHGADNLGLCGVVYYRGWMINTVITVPLIIILLFSRSILEAFGYSPEVSKYAMTFFVFSLPKTYFVGMWDHTKLYLGCFKNTVPGVFIQATTVLLHFAFLHLLVTNLELGLPGIGIASSISLSTIFLSIFGYVRYIDPRTAESLRLASDYSIWDNWSQYFKLGVPISLILFILSGTFQGLQIMAIDFGVPA